MQNVNNLISVIEAIRHFDIVSPVTPRRIALGEAVGLRSSEDIIIRRSLPEQNIAALNGWATLSSKITGASRSKAILLSEGSMRIDHGYPVPSHFDAVIPFTNVIARGDDVYAVASAVPGDGLVVMGSLCREGDLFLKAETRITINTAINGMICGIGQVVVRRPVVDIISNSRGITSENDRLMPLMGAAIRAFKASIGSVSFTSGSASDLANLIQTSSADVIATVGGIGNGANDTTLESLRKVCDVKFHGVRLNPGRSLAFSMIGEKPVYSLPANQIDIMSINSVLTSVFARKVFGRAPRPLANRQAKLLTSLPGGKSESSIYFGRVQVGKIEIIGNANLRPAEMATANALVIVMEGDRHRRIGETVFYVTL